MLELRLAYAGRWPALLRNRSIVSMLALGLVLSAGTNAVIAHEPANAATSNAATSSDAYAQVASIGSAVELEGTLQILHEDHSDGSSRYHYFLELDGERFELYFREAPPTHLLTGARVRVRGLRADHAVAVESGSRDIEDLLGAGSALAAPLLALSGTFGAQKTAVMLVNFSNNPVQPYTVAAARSLVFTTTSNYDLENSYGQTSLTGDVFGWYTIALSSTVCDYSTLATQARAAAAAAGVILSNYNRYVYAFPNNVCAWWGLGTVGGNPSSAWINGSLQLGVVGHEMGHNFGLYHSHALECGTVPIGTGCTSIEYGDTLDIMGGSSYHFNAFQKERLGWLNYGFSPPITTVSSSGTYSIDPYETVGVNPKALKIAIGTSGTYYYVELRRGTGFDAGMSGNANVMNGVVMHQGTPSNADSSKLLDMTATSSWSDPALVVGQSFTDSTAQITVTPISVTSTNASVVVSLGSSGCTRAMPSIAMSPSQSAAVAAGTAVSFTASMTNNDTANCGASTFDLTDTVPAGWGATLASAALALSPGTSGSTTLQVTSPASAANGSNAVNATATNRGATSYHASASAIYVVSTTTCTHANPTVTLSPSQSAGVLHGTAVSFTVSVTNRDNGACAPSTFDLTDTVASGWSATLASSALSLSPGATNTTTLQVTSPVAAGNGSYAVNATAKNRGATSYQASASATYVVSNTGGGTIGSFSDNFNRADSTTTIGTAWSVGAGKFAISSSMLKNAPQAGNAIAVVSALSGATQTAGADFTSVDNNLGPRFGIVLRYNDPKNYYLIYRQVGGSSRLLISKFLNGVETILASANLPNPAKFVPFHITGRITGTTLSLDFNGVVNKVTATDNDRTILTGKAGILIGPGGSSTIQQQADNFTATVQ